MSERHMVDPGADQLEHLARWIAGSPHNLVSRHEREITRLLVHLREAVAVGVALPVLPGQRWLDLGTGGGIPGLVLALQYPGAEWVLMDAVGKKARAVEEFAEALGLENVSVASGRAETLARDAGFRETFDGVVARAVAPLVVLVELARGFVRGGGLLAAVKGPGWEREAAQAGWAAQELGWRDVHGRPLPATVRPTWLVTMRAAGQVPETVPRRAGIPQRRPLVRTREATEG